MYQKQADVRSFFEKIILRPFVARNLINADFTLSYGGRFDNIIQSIGVPNYQIIRSPNGVSEEWLNKSITVEDNPRKFVFIGRYERRKGIEELHKAISRLLKREYFEMHFIGSIPEDLKIMHKNVIYWGVIREESTMKKVLCGFDVLICPSYSEGMPTVILESMASGLAIIGTRVGVVDSLVASDNGWLIDPGSLEQLITAMTKGLAISSDTLLSMKKNSQKKVHQYTWEKVSKSTLDGIRLKLKSCS